jgi:hypothetical protein
MSTAIVTPKFVQEYQATDADGNPIGHLTHLEADTQEELIEKLKQAHINASRALHKQNQAFNSYRKLKVTPATQAPPAQQLTVEQRTALVAGVSNPATAEDSIKKLAGTESLEARVAAAEARAKEADIRAAQFSFMTRHKDDYFPCVANAQSMSKYLNDNNLEVTVDNLEIAFAEIGDSLAQAPSTAAHQNNPTIAVQNPVTTPDLQPRRQPSFGVQPGTGSGSRPSNKPAEMTKKDILEKKKADPAWWKAQLKDPAKLAALNAILAKG